MILHEKDIAREFGVSERMIRKYRTLGMPRCEDGRYDLEVCRAWREANTFPELKGGNKGGGRPKSTWRHEDDPVEEEESDSSLDGKSLRELKEIREKQRARLDALEIAKAEGKLIDKAYAITMIRGHAVVLRQRMERITQNATKEVMAALSLGSDKTEAVRKAIETEIRRAVTDVSNAPLPNLER